MTLIDFEHTIAYNDLEGYDGGIQNPPFNGLCNNFAKCHLMLLGKKYLDTAQLAQIGTFHRDVIEVPDLKLLGLVIANKLSFKSYINQ